MFVAQSYAVPPAAAAAAETHAAAPAVATTALPAAIPAASTKATLVGGWGISQRLGQGEGGGWTTGPCGSDLDQHVRTPETTCFSLELGWQDTILEMEDMAETAATATAAH